MSRKILLSAILLFVVGAVQAAEYYVIDTKGMHAFITFKVKHLGFSWMEGRFDRFSGHFTFDEEDPSKNRVRVEIETASLDTNHAERDKHLRSARFFDVQRFPKATFLSTAWKDLGGDRARLEGRLTFRGVTKPVVIDVHRVGEGQDPWGGFRRGFEGTTTLHLSDYKMKEAFILGPTAEDIRIWLSIEGVRQ